MSPRELLKPATEQKKEKEMDSFILQGGSLPSNPSLEIEGERELVRFQMIMPKVMVDMIDEKRKKRMANVSRTFWIIELLEKALSKK